MRQPTLVELLVCGVIICVAAEPALAQSTISLADSPFLNSISTGYSNVTKFSDDVQAGPGITYYDYKIVPGQGDVNALRNDFNFATGYSTVRSITQPIQQDFSFLPDGFVGIGLRGFASRVSQAFEAQTVYTWVKLTAPPSPFGFAGSHSSPQDTTLSFSSARGASTYQITVASDPNFSHVVENVNVAAQSGPIVTADLGQLNTANLYYARGQAVDLAGNVREASNDGFRFSGAPQPVSSAGHQIIFATQMDSFVVPDRTVPAAPPFFGGQTAADWMTNLAASNAGLLKGWNQVDILYHAITSDAGSNAATRLEIAGPVYNVRGDLIANNAQQLWSGSLLNPVQYDATGAVLLPGAQVATGSTANGDWSTQSAGGWTDPTQIVSYGDASSANGNWLDAGLVSALGPLRLYGISPVLAGSTPYGYSQNNPVAATILPGNVLAFDNAQNGQWFDPPLGSSLVYQMTDGGLFTDIFDFPTGLSEPLHVLVGGVDLGAFGAGDHLVFANGGVSSFTITGIDPAADQGGDPFALKLGFNEDSANFDVTEASAAVPEPGSLVTWTLGAGIALGLWYRRERKPRGYRNG
jgi:hypothetical protein